jgi:hypothetical protein
MRLVRQMPIASVILVLLTLMGALTPAGPAGGPAELPPLELASSGRPRVTFLYSAPDPHVIRRGDRYFAYATNGTPYGSGNLYNIQRYESTDLASWSRTAQPDALPVRPSWAAQTGAWMWAPTVFRAASGQYVMFFAARSVPHGRQCIGRAVADTPDGTFRPTGSGPVICQSSRGGAIDPYYFRQAWNGSSFLYWKNDGNNCDPDCAVRLWGRRLDADGNLSGGAVALLTHDRYWETPLIENPAMTFSPVGNTHRLFYSANRYWTSSYSTGYADCAGPLGPCTKQTRTAPWHTSTPYAKGPGGAAFFQDFEGKNWMAYHGYQPGHIGSRHARFLFVEKVDFHARPTINTAFAYSFHRDPPHPFVDIPPGRWGADAISWLATDAAPFPAAATRTVATGPGLDPDELFQPHKSITRAELLNWVWKLEGHPGETPPPTHPPHPFGESVLWVRDALDWVAFENLMTGYSTNGAPPACGAAGPAPVFRPSCPINRGEYVRLLWRAHGSPLGYADPGFDDVPPTSWVFDAVSWAAGEGHMTGYADNTFKTGRNITRVQVANALLSLYGP